MRNIFRYLVGIVILVVVVLALLALLVVALVGYIWNLPGLALAWCRLKLAKLVMKLVSKSAEPVAKKEPGGTIRSVE